MNMHDFVTGVFRLTRGISHNQFGTAPGRWLQEKRLERACHLLQHTEKPISDVVLESGFVNLAHFDKLFKKQFGITPLKYRRQSSLPSVYAS